MMHEITMAAKAKTLSQDQKASLALFIAGLMFGILGNITANWLWEMVEAKYHWVLGVVATIAVLWVGYLFWQRIRAC
jgi:hypothetical protein